MIYLVAPYTIEPFENRSPQDVLDYFKDHKSIQLDTETTDFCPHKGSLVAMQIGDQKNQFVIDARFIDIGVFKQLIETKLCLLHNAKFDYKVLKKKGIILDKVWDTFLVEGVIFNGYDNHQRGLGLSDLVYNYLDKHLEKETRNSFATIGANPVNTRQIVYSGNDVKYLHDIAVKQYALVHKFDLFEATRIENEVFKALGDIEYNGMLLDVEKWKANTKEYVLLLSEIEKDLDKMVLEDKKLKKVYHPSGLMNLFGFEERQLSINYKSNQQIDTILRHLGIYIDSTSTPELKKVKGKHPIIPEIIKYRKTAKIVSTYGETFLKNINPVTGRVHTNFWQIRNTFRVSSGDKDNNNPNLQNIPADPKFRNCFVAPKGYRWFSSDYKGQEMRLLADFSGEDKLIDAINRGEDVHCFAYNEMTGESITEDDKDKRNKVKPINFGKPYGMGPPKLADSLGITLKEAEDLFDKYEKAFPKLTAYLKRSADFGKANEYMLTNPIHKGRRWFPMMKYVKEARNSASPDWKFIFTHEGATERESMNLPIQGTGAVIMKEALIAARNIIIEHGFDAKLISTVHDELSIEFVEHIEQELACLINGAMVEVGNKYVKKVDMAVDYTINNYWTK